MKNTENEKNNDDIENPEELIDDILSDLDSMHKELTDNAAKVGFARDAVQAIRPLWVSFSNVETSDPGAAEIYKSSFQVLKSVRDQIRYNNELGEPFFEHIKDTSGTITSFVTTSGSTAAFFDVSFEMPSKYNLVFESPDRHQLYKDRFSKFNPSLGDIYQGIWEVLYGTRSSRERSALYLIREAFDQLFRNLAPDDEVRSSQFWKPKNDENPELIYRHERLEYAANTHIKNRSKRESMVSSSKHMLSVYKELNRAHADEIDTKKSRKAIEEMRSILEDWADAIGF